MESKLNEQRIDGISVVICCYNSAPRIQETLHYLFLQHIRPGLNYEIVLVDNASTDNTKEKIFDALRESNHGILVTIVDETIPGLASARKKGLETARYELIIFCDDDNHLDEQYLTNAYELMQEHPEVGIAGGWIRPKLPFYPGKWLEGNYAALAIGKRFEESGYVDWVFGAGMVIRRKVFETFMDKGIQLMLSGRLGSKQTSGDDAEMCQLAQFVGYKVYFSIDLILDHKISAHRLTRWSFIKGNYRNVYPVVYFYLLTELIKRPDLSVTRCYIAFLRDCFYRTFYFFPRTLIGRFKFYSFTMLFQNVQLLLWLLMRSRNFKNTYRSVIKNLYHGSASGRL